MIYPQTCAACGENLLLQEHVICSSCLYGMPKTRFHLDPDNPVSMVFWGRVKIENATSFFHFNKGSKYQTLIHRLKYKGQQEVGEFLGKKLAAEALVSSSFREAEVVIPVPLHPKKQKKRGYNQSECIAKGIAEVMKIDLDCSSLTRSINTDTQTRKTRTERWENMKASFRINNSESLKGKHILLVDDVVTTGATLEACAACLLEIEGTKVSIATLALAN